MVLYGKEEEERSLVHGNLDGSFSQSPKDSIILKAQRYDLNLTCILFDRIRIPSLEDFWICLFMNSVNTKMAKDHMDTS